MSKIVCALAPMPDVSFICRPQPLTEHSPVEVAGHVAQSDPTASVSAAKHSGGLQRIVDLSMRLNTLKFEHPQAAELETCAASSASHTGVCNATKVGSIVTDPCIA